MLNIIKKCVSETFPNNNQFITEFVIDTYDINDSIQRYNLKFNLTTNFFNENEEIQDLTNIKTVIICSKENIDNKKTTLLLWNTAYPSGPLYLSLVYLNAFPIWLNKQENKSFCLRVDSVGWSDNVNAKICDDNDPNIPCPDLIVLGTTQLAYRNNNGETLDLKKYFRKFFKETGNSLESLMYKYSLYDYFLNNEWLAVPIIVDFRTFRFNKTTFDYCINKGYDLHYPPPLSDYWGTNYQKTWTWEKVVEYSKMITECTKNPGLKFFGGVSEDAKFFISYCQSVGIPFIIDDNELNIKKCGLRGKENIKKLLPLKTLFENHYIEEWLDPEQIENWKKKEYPKTIKDQPIFTYFKPQNPNYTLTNGMMIDVLDNSKYSDLFHTYYPGTSTFLGGSGIIITKKSKYPDILFEYIKILVDDNYPYFSELNVSITPFENIFGKRCNESTVKKSKKDLCNSLLESEGTYPYYFEYDGHINTIYLSHISVNSDRGILIDTKNSLNSGIFNSIFENKNYICDNSANYKKNTITYSNKYELLFPIKNNEVIILKSMEDIEIKLNDNEICSIYDDTLKKGKPMQFPYSTFSEINDFEVNAPVSLFLAHLYYKHNNTNEGSFEDILNECCDNVDYSFLPSCLNNNNIITSIGECDEKTLERKITYINCKLPDNSNNDIRQAIQCSYIPYKNSKGIFITVLVGFLISLIISTIILNISVLFWIGEYKKINCILKVWTMIIGITGFISSYSIKSEIIISVYNNRNITKSNNKYRSFLSYIIMGIIQTILLIIWTFTQKGVIQKERFKDNINYSYDICSYGNEYIITIIYSIDYILLLISIFMAYRGRKVPSDFYDSKKVFITSLISIFLLTLCYLAVIMDFNTITPYIIILILIILTTLVINIIFIIPKVLIIFNINIESEVSVVVVSTQNKIDTRDFERTSDKSRRFSTMYNTVKR
ncbi:hypothetical protein BCR32DRAFT_292924 [Anaeromyces robustus]|uniref:G-protein coupled receptors family 3 profile domain-containing protein n=1 Tax=Anaeromyces robustus TaxID=1754192 RepID=A0A1Y1X8G7_9FUNG|nr:hypothetical protein BCR32DRAFT_292924 [Anaeromyces robustus]|eukprot:ORX82022.1 hypothetical protein BCR32DRAFT_292924 [Anaeromyces robustus]